MGFERWWALPPGPPFLSFVQGCSTGQRIARSTPHSVGRSLRSLTVGPVGALLLGNAQHGRCSGSRYEGERWTLGKRPDETEITCPVLLVRRLKQRVWMTAAPDFALPCDEQLSTLNTKI